MNAVDAPTYSEIQIELATLYHDCADAAVRASLESMVTRMASAPGVLRAVLDAQVSRTRVGFEKYQQTVDRQDLTEEQWLQHLEQELLDASLYIEAARRRALANRDAMARVVELEAELDELRRRQRQIDAR